MNNKMTIYKVFKTLLSPIYKLWYNPKIIGKENIPKEGPIILAGNHVHIMDQCNIIISTKRPIHYLAKKEYFDKKYKEGKFAWFFKTSGCIPVDRDSHDENAKRAAIEVLKQQKVLGIFPEGTRNKLKDSQIKEIHNKYFNSMNYKEFTKKIKNNKTSFIYYFEELKNKDIITKKEYIDNIFNCDSYLKELIEEKKITKKDYYDNYILPLKYGAVSMANKTNALIVPYAITGEYKFRSKNLTIRIGKPFYSDENLELANQKLNDEIKDLIKINLENSGK